MASMPLNQIIAGNCIEVMDSLAPASADLIFADPPYNLQLPGTELHRPDNTASRVQTVTDAWDRFDSLATYDEFTQRWLTAARRVLKDTGTIWVMGSYHNIYRVGAIMQDLDFWLLNDVVWVKSNPLPQMRGTRFCNAHETLLWAQKHKGAKYTFNYHTLKAFNDSKQMRSDWWVSPICQGKERFRGADGKAAHPTQKPEALLYRVLLSSTNPGDVVLDPFFGTGTSGAVAKRLHRNYIGIEQDGGYIELARHRLDEVKAAPYSEVAFLPQSNDKKLPKVPFAELLATGYVLPGQLLKLAQLGKTAIILADGRVSAGGATGSIHQVAKLLLNNAGTNGWTAWLCKVNGQWVALDNLRQQYRERCKTNDL